MNFENEIYAGNSVMTRFFGDPSSDQLVNQGPLKPAVAYRSFLDWLKQRQPEVFANLAYTRPDLVSPEMMFESAGFLGDVETDPETATEAQSILDRSLDTLQKLLPTYYQYQTQRQLIDLNIERAKQGLTPVDSGTLAPTVKVGVSSDIQRMLTFGLVGAFGLAALNIFTRNKRR
jgi:hypothetical protein